MRRKWTVTLAIVIGAGMIVAAKRTVRPSGARDFRPPTPPLQPVLGPGSTDYAHGGMVEWSYGVSDRAFYVFEPADPVPASAPVIAFLHGYAADQPRSYIAWISHLVRRGNIVIYPVYQTNNRPPASTYTPAALAALEDAVAVLSASGRVAPRWEHFALVGHSLGGVIAANLAALMVDAGLPTPRALLLANAADATTGPGGAFESILDDYDYGTFPQDLLMLAVVGDEDRVVGAEAARTVFSKTPHVSAQNKEIVLLPSDDHGFPPLVASHPAAGAVELALLLDGLPNAGDRTRASPIDALDFYGYWKWFDALTDTAFFGQNREYALGRTPEQLFMGLWSDGAPVTPARVIWP